MWCYFLWFLIALPMAFSQQAQAPAEKKPAALAGRIVNSKTSEPVRRVNVTLRPMGPPGMAGSMSFGPMAPAAPYAATTDAEGKFRIEGVEPGMYRMMAEKQGFVRKEYGARKNSMMGSTITVTSGQELKELNIDLIPQA
ncbi:MAG TPA: carboxypeptidase-like regulatory domain-containing protein, partial [Bryobacteraceae bacterium]|nr:carboxypeptidase-like regulatory domain-containing protein [Bryobacteraceae bacterium]